MPKTSRDEATREEILQAARRVFQRWGRTRATLEDIARVAGKGKSTLYYYYESKEEIFDTVVRLEIDGLLSRAKASVREVRSAKERLRNYIVALMVEMRDTPILYDIVRGEINGDPHFLEKARGEFEPGEVEYLQEILALGVQQGHFAFANDGELAMTAKTVHKIVGALELSLFLENFESSHVDRTARLIANGI